MIGAVRRRLGRLRRATIALVVRWRAWWMQRVFLPLRGRRAARLRYAAVLDGQTLNLHAELPATAHGADRAEIVVSGRRRRHVTEARVYDDGQGRTLVDAAVLLGAGVGGADLTPGRWRLRLRVETGRRTRRIPLLLLGAPHSYEGTTRPMDASPVTGDRYRIGWTATGNARIRCTPARPAVEVVDVHIEHARIDVDVRLLGMADAAGWSEFVASGRRVRRDLAEVEPGVWRVEVPLADMVPRADRREHWDVVLCGAGRRPLRFARRLHDLSNPQRVFSMRKIVVAPQRDHLMTIEPRYTPTGNLRFTCSRVSTAA
ncbi:hypothetical protein ABZ958_21255 [Streptomyces sp. NPDC046237]|uniref:hypothetical protein n=1 Tax=Streptomyces sp. NPDC046237 TaxID=3154914 RepID=UPI0033DDB098